MSTALSDSNTYTTTIVIPSSGEARTAASLAPAFQGLSNRTSYLKDRLLYLDPTRSGVMRVRTVADLDALRAISSSYRADGDAAYVKRLGLYFFEELALDESVNATGDSRQFIRPDDVASDSDPGRWVHSQAGTFGPTIIDIQTQVSYEDQARTNTTWVTLPPTITMTLKALDEVYMTWDARTICTDATGTNPTSYTRFVVTSLDRGAEVPIWPFDEVGGADVTKYQRRRFGTVFQAVADGEHVFAVQQRVGASPSAWLVGEMSLHAMQIRR